MTCRHCGVPIEGKPEKQYCSIKCKKMAAYRRKYAEMKMALAEPPVIICGYCDIAFRSPYPRTTYCSDTCGQRARRRRRLEALGLPDSEPVVRHCEVCNEPMGPHKMRYCGEACTRKAEVERDTARKRARGKAECGVCGQHYTQQTGRHLYCGQACAGIAKAKQAQEMASEKLQLIALQPIGQCQGCGREFERTPKKTIYCTIECRNSTSGQDKQPSGVKGFTTMAEIVAHNATLAPLEGCARCKRRTGHDDWCPNGMEG